MIRALVIRLGDALAPVQERLQVEFEIHQQRDERSVILRTHDAPVAAVGNLSRPVQVLREQLEAALVESLGELLSLKPGDGGEFVLDVFVMLNLGEPLVANATSVIIEMLDAIVDANFRAIFPRHRTGSARRFRIVPIAILPAAADCEKARSDAIDELQSLHDTLVEGRDGDDDFFVDRVFLLDAMTSRGIASLDDLVDQVLAFLRLVIFGGVRRDPDFVRLLEADHSDLFATFGVAVCEVDYHAVATALRRQMTATTAQALAEEARTVLPRVDELLNVRVLDDAAALELALGELEALPLRTLAADGCGAVGPLLGRYDALAARVDEWRAASEETDSGDEEPAAAVGGGVSGAFWISFVVALGLGAAVAVAAHYIALASLAAVIGSGGGVAFIACLAIWLVLRQPRPPQKAAAAAPRPVSTETRGAVFDAIEHTVEQQRTKLRQLDQALVAVRQAFDADGELTFDPPGDTHRFREPLVSSELLRSLYEQRVATADPRAVAAQWLDSVGDWSALLGGTARPTAALLDAYCASRFTALGHQPMFQEAVARHAVSVTLRGFATRWRAGVGAFLEGESRMQFDPDGFDGVFSNCVFAPVELHADLSAAIEGSTLRLHRTPVVCDDVFVITALTDIHPDAVSPLADRKSAHE